MLCKLWHTKLLPKGSLLSQPLLTCYSGPCNGTHQPQQAPQGRYHVGKMCLGLTPLGLRSYGVVLWEIITGERPDKLRGLRAPECARFLSLSCSPARMPEG